MRRIVIFIAASIALAAIMSYHHGKTFTFAIDLQGSDWQKLEQLGKVEINAHSPFPTALIELPNKCPDGNLAEPRYYILSSDTQLSDDAAIWACLYDLASHPCPDLTITPAGPAKANVTLRASDKDEHSKTEVATCVERAITVAETELTPTSLAAARRLSWN